MAIETYNTSVNSPYVKEKICPAHLDPGFQTVRLLQQLTLASPRETSARREHPGEDVRTQIASSVLCIELFLLLCLYIVNICVSEIDTNSHYHQTKARQ